MLVLDHPVVAWLLAQCLQMQQPLLLRLVLLNTALRA